MQPENKPKISVVMPTFNRSNIIQHAIRSVIDQTFKDWELIIVDDGSEDGTKRIVESFANPRIKYHIIDHCGFVSKVRNWGNNLAIGDIIVVHDSDDMAFPDRLEEIVKAFDENPDADLVYHGFYSRFFDPFHNAITRNVRPALPYSKERLLQQQYIPGQVAYKRETILRIPYDERIRCCDDYQILLEFALNDCKFIPIYKNLYEYNDSSDSINVSGEADGSRKRDVEIILKILKEKYNTESSAMMVKNTVAGELISRDFIFGKDI